MYIYIYIYIHMYDVAARASALARWCRRRFARPAARDARARVRGGAPLGWFRGKG